MMIKSRTNEKVSNRSPFLILLFFSLFSLAEAGENPFFSKIGISPIKDKKAPNFFLEDLNNKKVELKQYKGKVVFLNFWATWCSPCKEEMPSMEALYQQFKKKDFVFLAISVDYESREKIREFIEKRHFTLPVLVDPKCFAFDLYGVKGIPTTFLIDKKGSMIGKAIGPRDWKSPEMISLLNHMVSE